MSEIALPLQLGGKNYQPRIIFWKIHFRNFTDNVFFCYCTRDKEEERSNRIERKRNVKSKGKAHKDGARMQRMTKRREGHLHHGRGEGKHHFEVGCCIVHFALCPSPFAAEIQINDKSASAFQPSSPYFIPLSQYSILPPSPQHWKSTGRITSPSSSISLLFEFPSTNSFTSSRKGNDYEDKEKSRIRSSFSAKRYDQYISFFFFFNFKFIDLIYHNLSILAEKFDVVVSLSQFRLFQPNRRFVSAHFSVVSFSRFKEFRESLARQFKSLISRGELISAEKTFFNLLPWIFPDSIISYSREYSYRNSCNAIFYF